MLFFLISGCSNNEMDDLYDQGTTTENMKQATNEINQVFNDVEYIFHKAENAADMAKHLDEIKKMELVETAWNEDDAIFAKLKNGITIFWFFPSEEEDELNSNASFTNNDTSIETYMSTIAKSRAAAVEKPTLSHDIKVCIINQYIDEPNTKPFTEKLKEDAQVLRRWGYTVDEISGSEFTPKFIMESLHKYNVVLLCTHGLKETTEDKNKLHWLLTGLELPYINSNLINS